MANPWDSLATAIKTAIDAVPAAGGTDLVWSDKIAEAIFPFMGAITGEIKTWPGVSLPSGFLWCDGVSYLITAQQGLFDEIGTSWGAIDGIHFNVPKLQGYFLRGVDNGAGIDPDAAGRTAIATGGNTGDNVGSVQADQYKGHTHGPPTGLANFLGRPGVGGTWTDAAGGALVDTSQGLPPNTVAASGGNETRSINAYVNFIIKT